MGEGQNLHKSEAVNDEIKRYLSTLKGDIHKETLSSEERVKLLESLKSRIISAEAAAAFSQDDVKVLYVYALEESRQETTTSLTALKCLANLLLLASKTRQYFVDEYYAAAVAKKLRVSPEYELLCSRILFLLTYDTTFNFETLFEKESLADHIHENIAAHASRYARNEHGRQHTDKVTTDGQSSTLEPGALTETLKLLFNLNQFYANHIPDFTRTITPILEILNKIQIQVPVLQQPLIALINSLLSLDLPGPVSPDSHQSLGSTPLFPESPYDNCRCLINILNAGIRASREEESDSFVPLITLLRRVYELAPRSVKRDMQAQLLPSNEERAQPLGKSDSLASRLLNLSTSPTAPRLKEGISSFLFELSDNDAATFVRNVGYGFAAGYLMTHNVPIPQDASGDPGKTVTTVDGQEINPVTGQRRDMEPASPLPEMTDEEKEREAERLFVLFERLKATGVMNVMNPVQQAVDEGRFEEVD